MVLTWEHLVAVLGACGIAYGIYTNRKNNKRNESKEVKEDTAFDIKLAVDMEYLKRNSDDTKFELKTMNKSFGDMTERIVKVEESTKQAHKRMDEHITSKHPSL